MRVIDLSTLSLVGGSGIAEAKIVLWSADGTSISTTATGSQYIQDGSTSVVSNTTYPPTITPIQLFTLSSNWFTSLNYAFEVTLWVNSAPYSATARLLDLTAGKVVASVNTFSTTATVLRSSTFSQYMTLGHVYGVQLYPSSSSGTAYLSDASLIIFP